MLITKSILGGAVTIVALTLGVSAERARKPVIATGERLSTEVAAATADVIPTCAAGPDRLSEMTADPGGFLKTRARGVPDHREFYFTRAMFTDRGGRDNRRGDSYLGDGGPTWSIDYPSADRHMMIVTTRLTNLNACEWENPVSLADPDLRRYPFLYTLEWGEAALTEAEVTGLHDYLEAGGLLMIDDFWGTSEWNNFERQLRRVTDREIVDIPRTHLLFRAYYPIEGDIMQVPGVRDGRDVGAGRPGAQTWQNDGYEPYVRGIFDDDGRLMVVIYANTDLGDAMEWAEDPYYPLEFSKYATQLFLNTIIYAMTQ